MLYTLLAISTVSFICLLAGILFYELVFPHYSEKIHPRSFIVYIITGLIMLTAIVQWLVLFVPITLFVSLSIILILLLLFAMRWYSVLQILNNFYRNFIRTPLILKLGIIVLILMILIVNTGPLKFDDTGTYHLQIIKWMQEYGTVPGLANLHLRFGFNSSWFDAISLFSPHNENISAYHTLNGALSCWFGIYLCNKAVALFSKNAIAGPVNISVALLLVLATCILSWPMIRGNAASTNYDFITTCCIVILFIEGCTIRDSIIRTEYILWPCFLFTVRIINFPILLIAVWLLWKFIRQKEIMKFTGGILIAVLLITPFIIRNVILSGYAFFPSQYFDLFSVDWKADRTLMANIVKFIRYYNRVHPRFKPLEETARLSFPGWVSNWYYSLAIIDKLFFSFSMSCFIASLFGYKRLRAQLNGGAVFFILALIAQLILWFFVAPHMRFVYGPLLCGIVLFFLSLSPFVMKPIVKGTGYVGAVILFAGCLVYCGRKMTSSTAYQNFLLPHPLSVTPVQPMILDGIQLNIPEKSKNNWNTPCNDTDPPCLYNVHPGLRARGQNITDGFYIDPNINYRVPKGAWH
jgi:hypothetical protein